MASSMINQLGASPGAQIQRLEALATAPRDVTPDPGAYFFRDHRERVDALRTQLQVFDGSPTSQDTVAGKNGYLIDSLRKVADGLRVPFEQYLSFSSKGSHAALEDYRPLREAAREVIAVLREHSAVSTTRAVFDAVSSLQVLTTRFEGLTTWVNEAVPDSSLDMEMKSVAGAVLDRIDAIGRIHAHDFGGRLEVRAYGRDDHMPHRTFFTGFPTVPGKMMEELRLQGSEVNSGHPQGNTETALYLAGEVGRTILEGQPLSGAADDIAAIKDKLAEFRPVLLDASLVLKEILDSGVTDPRRSALIEELQTTTRTLTGAASLVAGQEIIDPACWRRIRESMEQVAHLTKQIFDSKQELVGQRNAVAARELRRQWGL